MRTYFRSDATIAIDTIGVLLSTETATSLMNLFFQVVGVIAMVLCFFILFLSFTSNVNENSWEFGVLRAIGLSNVEVVMVYVYEALALTASCVVLGTMVGLLIAISLTLQFNLFTEMPFAFEFPYGLYFSMVLMALCCAVVGM
jgi:ABC-type antimicrobial peptide transport system permease subunit